MTGEKSPGMAKKQEMKKYAGKRGIRPYPGVWGRLCLAFALLVCLSAFSVASYGAEGTASSKEGGRSGEMRVYDEAGLFTEPEIRNYEAAIGELRESLDFDVVLVTTEDAEGRTGQEYADEFYDYGGFGEGSGHDGILFLIDMDNRELAFSTFGKAMRIFTDARIEEMLDHVYEGAEKDDFAASAEAFLEDVEYYGEKGIPGGQYNYDQETGAVSRHKSIRWYEALFAFAVSGIVAVGACLNVKKEYAMEADERQINGANMAYRADCQFEFQSVTDPILDKRITSRVIPRTTNYSSGSRSSSSSSSRSGTRTTTHRSSSGRSHGGGSRRF